MKIYISGKITGLEYNEAYCAFVEAEQVLKKLGHEPVNPMKKVAEQQGKTWAEYMKEDIPLLLECDGIYLLRNYTGSKGAKLELHIAEQLGMAVFGEQGICDVCRVSASSFKNKLLLGTDDALCRECFDLWYDGGIADKAEMRRRRLGINTCASLGGMNEICMLPIDHEGMCSGASA